MIAWLSCMAALVLAVWGLDRLWLQHVARTDRPLHDPEGYLEVTARITELCHGDRVRADALIEAARASAPALTHGQAVRLAMQQLLAPSA